MMSMDFEIKETWFNKQALEIVSQLEAELPETVMEISASAITGSPFKYIYVLLHPQEPEPMQHPHIIISDSMEDMTPNEHWYYVALHAADDSQDVRHSAIFNELGDAMFHVRKVAQQYLAEQA